MDEKVARIYSNMISYLTPGGWRTLREMAMADLDLLIEQELWY